jgi:CxxC motif-containing protein (DUF1111 family)
VDTALFEAVVLFQELHAVPVTVAPTSDSAGVRVFRETGCAVCHKPDLPVEMPDHSTGTIHAYTDLLLHDMGDDLADRTLDNRRVHSEWRTAPLWGIGASFASSQTLRLLHDGRARTIEEAVLWHGGAGTAARDRFVALDAAQQTTLLDWLRTL